MTNRSVKLSINFFLALFFATISLFLLTKILPNQLGTELVHTIGNFGVGTAFLVLFFGALIPKLITNHVAYFGEAPQTIGIAILIKIFYIKDFGEKDK